MTPYYFELFMSHVIPEPTTGCWLWAATCQKNGYGVVGRNGKTYRAHRVSYEHFVGPIPPGMQIDHVRARGCATRSCVNPDHLEVVTLRENLRRGDSPLAINGRKTHCKHGHPFDEANTARKPLGRNCRACDARRAREKRAERMAQPDA